MDNLLSSSNHGYGTTRWLKTNTNATRRHTEVPSQSKEIKTSPYIPFAERLRKIKETLPPRFRPYHVPSKNPSPKPIVKSRRLTVPHSPKLLTKRRCESRPQSVKQPKTYQQFKALPLNRKILESKGNLGVTKFEKKPNTIPVTPPFGKKERPKVYVPVVHLPPQAFKSTEYSITVPKPFKLSKTNFGKYRKHTHGSYKTNLVKNSFKARPMPDFGSPTPLTQPEPFQFSNRNFRRPIIPIEVQEKPWKALPMPKFDKVLTIHKSENKLTTPISPKFLTKKRAVNRTEHHQHQNNITTNGTTNLIAKMRARSVTSTTSTNKGKGFDYRQIKRKLKVNGFSYSTPKGR